MTRSFTNVKKGILCALTLLLAFTVFAASPIKTLAARDIEGTAILGKNAEWKYEDSGTDLTGTDWNQADYDDSAWKSGRAPMGFGDDYSETDVRLAMGTVVSFGPDANNKIMTTYFRTVANVESLEGINFLKAYIHVDDGAVVYINGQEAFRAGIDEGDVVYDTSGDFGDKESTFIIPQELLVEGENIIAAEVHQDDGGSSDLHFELALVGMESDETFFTPKQFTEGITYIPRNMVWSYDDSGADLTGTDWNKPEFDDSAWASGQSPLGFGDDFSETDNKVALATEVSYGDNEEDKHMTTYFRSNFEAYSLSEVTHLQFYIHTDDGAVVYVNGEEVFHRGIEDGDVAFDTPAEFDDEEEIIVLPLEGILVEGENTIAAEVHQDDGTSSDLWFELYLLGLTSASPVTDDPVAVSNFPDENAELGEVRKVTVTFNGNTETNKGFTWYTTLRSGNSDLQVFEKGDEANPYAMMAFEGEAYVSYNAPGQAVHKAVASGLTPDTEYFFRVGDRELDLWSEMGSFTTGMEGAFSFINLTDTQAKTIEESDLAAQTIRKAFETSPAADFFVLNGDLVDTGATESEWDALFSYAAETLMSTTIAPAAGNHDEDDYSFIDHFSLPTPYGADVTSGAYYSFDYGYAHFVILNTNEDSPEYADLTPAQVDWMKADIEAAQAKGARWIIVSLHKGPYTTSNHATDDDIMNEENGVRTLIGPMFEELGVDLVMQGHDHHLSRSLPLSASEPAEAGTTYITPGSAGPKVYYKNSEIDASYYDLFAYVPENSAAKYGSDPEDPSRPVRSQIQHFVEFFVEYDVITAVVYEIDQSLNEARPFVVDTFEIAKDVSVANITE